MRLSALIFLVACNTAPTTNPALNYDPGPWFVGEQQTMSIQWPASIECNSNGFDCTEGSLVSFQVDHVTCTGCTASGVELGADTMNAASFEFVATTTEPIEIVVDVDSDGDKFELVADGVGDRELALQARCQVVWTTELDDSELEPQDCGATRSADQSILIDWSIATERGDARLPFCPDDATECEPAYPRKTSSIQLTPPPQIWRDLTPIYSDVTASTVTMTVPLASGALSSASVAIPPLQ